MRNHKKSWRVALVVLVCLQMVTASTPAFADLLAYDGFENYALGNIVGQANMGTGFDNGKNWRRNNGTNHVVAGGLTYSAGGVDLLVSGNQHVETVVGGGQANATTNDLRGDLDVSDGGPFAALLTEPGSAKIGVGTIYFSWLGQRASDSSGWGGFGGVGFHVGNDATINHPAADDIQFSRDGETHLIVGKIEFNAGGGGEDLLTAWDNPTPGTAEGTTGTIIVSGPRTLNQFDLNSDPQWVQNDGINQFISRGLNPWSFDEIRFGTTFEDVTPSDAPIPEPTSLLLALLGLMGLMSIRRRRRRN